MYETFFRLTDRPFAAAPNRHQYYAAGPIQHARQTLARCITRAEGPALLIGPPGTGKTLLCQLLADDFAGQLDCASLASGNLGTARSLLQVLLHELQLPYRGLDEGELRLALADRVLRQPGERGVLLVVDEAQVLPARLLEELRLMTNLVRDGQPQVRLVLSGSAELEERFASPKLESFSQRIAARSYLEAFNRDETRGYVAARIAASGQNLGTVFANDAIDQIYQATEGIPRLINQLADHALILGFTAGLRPLDGRVIKEAWADLQQLPTPWNQANPDRTAGEASGETETIEFGVLEDEPDTNTGHSAEWPAAEDEPETVPWPHFAGSIVTEVESTTAASPSWKEARAPFQFPTDANLPAADFLEEEVVIDAYATLDAKHELIRHRVVSVEGRALWAQLAPHAAAVLRQSVRIVNESEIEFEPAPAATQPAAPAAESRTSRETMREVARPVDELRVTAPPPPAAQVPADSSHIDDDLIIIEDDVEALELAKAPGFGRARRQEYTQLFKKLRNG